MEIDVRNIGPLKRAKFDLRPLTVFIGTNNTGKSWLASIAYALSSYTRSTTYLASVRKREYELHTEKKWSSFAKNPGKILENLQKRNQLILDEEDYNLALSFLNLDLQAEAIKKEIYRCIPSIKSSHIVRTNSVDDSTISVHTTHDNNFTAPANFVLDVNRSAAKLTSEIQKKICIDEQEKQKLVRLIQSLSLALKQNESHRFSHDLFIETVGLLNKNICFASHESLYLPAERIGLINNFRTFLSSGFQHNVDSNLRRSTGVNLDFVKKLLDLPRTSGNDDFSSEVSRIEEKILDGKIIVEHDELDLPQFFFEPNSELNRIPLNSASSMISQIAPVVLFLRYYGRQFRMLIIEEPEAHLHPESQEKFIQEICSWIKCGYKILITTHSEWIIEELSNQVLSNEIKISKGIAASEVGVWEFKGSSGGSTVREIRWKPDDTGYNDGFEKVADKISNTWFEHHERLERIP